MANKPTKIDDVKHPDKVTPASTSRPILVTNRPILANDPMMAPAAGDNSEPPKPAEPITRTAKTIEPMGSSKLIPPPVEPEKPAEPSLDASPANAEASPPDLAVAELDLEAKSQTEPPASVADTEPAATPEAPEEPAAESETPADTAPAAPEVAADATTTPQAPAETSAEVSADAPRRDSDAQVAADEVAAQEAQSARQQELEQLIASGKYAVPINAAARKRSHVYLLLGVVVIVLALALLDIALDTGLLKTSLNLPHTHLF